MAARSIGSRLRYGFNKWVQDTKEVISGEMFRLPSTEPIPLIDFKTNEDVAEFKLVCDSALGGHSKATFELGDGSIDGVHAGVLSGYLSVADATNRELVRSGYVGVTSPEQFPPWNIAQHPELELRCRTDGRLYAINVHCEMAFDTGLIWQGFIHGGAGEWRTLQLPLTRFLPVMSGRLASGKWSPDLENLLKLGVSVMGKQGPFKFELEYIHAIPDQGRGQPESVIDEDAV